MRRLRRLPPFFGMLQVETKDVRVGARQTGGGSRRGVGRRTSPVSGLRLGVAITELIAGSDFIDFTIDFTHVFFQRKKALGN